MMEMPPPPQIEYTEIDIKPIRNCVLDVERNIYYCTLTQNCKNKVVCVDSECFCPVYKK